MATVDVIANRNTASEILGKAYFETDTNSFIVYNGSGWVQLQSDGVGAAAFSNEYSLEFDGANHYIDAGSSPSALTVEGMSVWFKSDLAYGSGVQSFLIGLGGSDQGIAFGGDFFGPVPNEVITVCNNNHLWSYAGSGLSLTADTWHHLGVRWESSNSSTNSGNAGYDIYLDGTKVGNTFGTYSSGIGSKITTQRLTAGARNRNGSVSFQFNGKIDDFAIFTSSVSENDLLAMYNSGSGPIDLESYTPGLWWRMGDDGNDSPTNGGSVSGIQDSSGNGNHATQSTASYQPTFSTDVPA